MAIWCLSSRPFRNISATARLFESIISRKLQKVFMSLCSKRDLLVTIHTEKFLQGNAKFIMEVIKKFQNPNLFPPMNGKITASGAIDARLGRGLVFSDEVAVQQIRMRRNFGS